MNQPIICDLTVFPADVRREMAASVPNLFRAAQQAQELPDGYAFEFPNEPGMFMALANFVEHERQCCPFYHFSLVVEPDGGPFWLRMTGGEGVKEFMQTAWMDLTRAAVQQLILIGANVDLDETIARSAPVMAGVIERAMPLSAESDQ
jgi:hypothetical protein